MAEYGVSVSVSDIHQVYARRNRHAYDTTDLDGAARTSAGIVYGDGLTNRAANGLGRTCPELDTQLLCEPDEWQAAYLLKQEGAALGCRQASMKWLV